MGFAKPARAARHWLSYGLAGLLLLMLLFLVFGEWGLLHYWRLSAERTRVEERTRALQQANETLREKIHRLGHDDRYLEKVVREELGLVRDGEIVYRFPNVGPADGPGVNSPSFGSPPSSARNARP